MDDEGIGTASPPGILFCPADDERKLRRISERRAPAVALDLEDAVAPGRREHARRLLAELGPGIACSVRTYVRINAWGSPDVKLDIESLRGLPIAGVLVAKVESAEQIRAIDEAMGTGSDGFANPAILPMIETARGLVDVTAIANAAPGRIETLVLGTADLSADLGLTPSWDAVELAPYRATVVAATRAAGLSGPIDGPELNLDLATFSSSCERSRRAGFAGRVCLTPDQAQVASTAYTQLIAAEVDRLRNLVEAYEAARFDGLAVARVGDGFVDAPVYHHARRALDQHFTYADHDTHTKGLY